ncbi:MAG: hypothetical protein V7K89_35285 [Nostoc sp.]|uniref:hypothetical protein n=1 Tax=Nostoc sp. TaxID=1180 RepID=UPI002FF8ACEA
MSKSVNNRLINKLKSLLDLKVMVTILAITIALYALIFNNRAVELTFNQEGTTVLMKGDEPSKAIVLLPANKLWLNTGLSVKPGQEVKIAATGSVNVAIHRLINSTKEHKPLEPGWLDPAGDQGTSRNAIDELRKQYLIDPNAPFGSLIAGIFPEGKAQLGKDNPHPDGLEIYSVGKEKSFRSKEGGKLWLVVNDSVLNKDAKDAYVPTQQVLDEAYPPPKSVTVNKRLQEWENIKSRRYFQAFFDDNVGEFLVQIEF